MLTDTQIRNLKPKPRIYRMADAYGLEIEITVDVRTKLTFFLVSVVFI